MTGRCKVPVHPESVIPSTQTGHIAGYAARATPFRLAVMRWGTRGRGHPFTGVRFSKGGVAPSARRAGGQLVLRSERKTPNPDSLVVEDDESSGREIVGHRVEVGDDQRGDVVGSAAFLTS
jgi:hypothetical protein